LQVSRRGRDKALTMQFHEDRANKRLRD